VPWGQTFEVRWRDTRGQWVVRTGLATENGTLLEFEGPPIAEDEAPTGSSAEDSAEPAVCNHRPGD